MLIRHANQNDRAEWLRMRTALWPAGSREELYGEMEDQLAGAGRYAVFVVERETGRLGGFLEASLRAYADGCRTSPVGYIEGWYVDAVNIYAPAVITPPVVPVSATLYQYNGSLILRWAPDTNTHYRIYSGPTSDNALETLEGSTTENHFTIAGGATPSIACTDPIPMIAAESVTERISPRTLTTPST